MHVLSDMAIHQLCPVWICAPYGWLFIPIIFLQTTRLN